MAEKTKKKKEPISSFSILLILLVVLAVISWIAAAATGGTVTAASLSNILTSPIYGFTGAPTDIVEGAANPDTFPGGALEVCFFVMILGGFLGVMTKTGALDNGIAVLVKKLKGNELVLIPILMILFSIGGTTYGMCEETVPFYVLLAATMYAAGFDAMVGSAVVLLGAGCGVLGSTVNPFAVGAAVSSLVDAGIQVNQGIIIALGAILWISTTAVSIIYVMKYAAKVKKDRGSTILSLQEQEAEKENFGKDNALEDVKLTGRQKGALIVFAIAFIVMVISFIPWEDFGVEIFLGWSAVITGLPLGEWYFVEAACWFFILALIIAVVGGLTEAETVKAFIDGTADMMSVVMIIALALDSVECFQRFAGCLRVHLRAGIVAALRCAFVLDSVELRHGNRVHAHHGPLGCEPRFLGRDHGHDLQLRKWLREPVHSYLRRDYGWLGSCSCAVRHVA